jgi:hypothetical protein
MYINEEKEVTRKERVTVAVQCDKCGILITDHDKGYHKYVGFDAHPEHSYPDDWYCYFQLCPDCAEDLIENWLQHHEGY